MINVKNKEEAKDLQNFLLKYDYDLGKWGADGDFGKTSKKALDAMVEDVKNPPVKIPEIKKLSGSLEDKIQYVLSLSLDYGFTKKQTAYVLATVKRETGNTFDPDVREAWYVHPNSFEDAEDWRRRKLRYYPYYGRGPVQLTWLENYKKFSKILGVDLVNNPDLALEPEYAYTILLYGFKYGTFTGKKISDYINNSKTDYFNARRCINGTDSAQEIADNAVMYYNKYFS